MWHLLKRHPVRVEAHFDFSLVLTFAFEPQVLEPLLFPGLQLDVFERGEQSWGFVAIALVQTRSLRPSFLPHALGQRFFLSGYRIFSRYQTPQGRTLRGLRILRSDTDKPLMALAGNLLTHYNYKKARVDLHRSERSVEVEISTPHGEADLNVVADLSSRPAPLPAGSPFETLDEARQFAGPLPWTFDFEEQTNSIVRIKGVRKKWDPQPVAVEIEKCSFFDKAPFQNARPVLANAFYLSDVPYQWEKGICEKLPAQI